MDTGGILATGLIGLLVWALVTGAGIALGIWITYEIIWRAVRRGMREFNANPGLPRNAPRLR